MPPEEAVAAAFEAWFTSPWRVETCRLSICTAYLDRLDDSKRLRSYAPLPESCFDGFCSPPDGRACACRPPG